MLPAPPPSQPPHHPLPLHSGSCHGFHQALHRAICGTLSWVFGSHASSLDDQLSRIDTCQLIVSVSSLLLSGKLLEPIWGMREFLKFTVFVNTCTLAGVYVTAITSYYITRREAFLYMPLFGFHGVISSFLVGVKQIVPSQEIVSLGGFCLRAKWLPSLFVLMSIILSFFTSEAMPYLPFVLFGTYSGWLYARYLVRDPETNLLGSPGEEFAFSTFFPPFLRSTVDVLSSCCYTLLCQRRVPRKEEDNVLESTSSPFPDSAEVFRWRERGARALDQKLQDPAHAYTDSESPAPSIV